jgi:type 1 fimbriae regulatory protein FimB
MALLHSARLNFVGRYLFSRQDKLPWLFVWERGQPMTRQAVNYLIRESGERAGLGRVWPHMLRHSAGYALSNKGRTSACCRTSWGTEIPAIQHATRGQRPAASRDSGNENGDGC